VLVVGRLRLRLLARAAPQASCVGHPRHRWPAPSARSSSQLRDARDSLPGRIAGGHREAPEGIARARSSGDGDVETQECASATHHQGDRVRRARNSSWVGRGIRRRCCSERARRSRRRRGGYVRRRVTDLASGPTTERRVSRDPARETRCPKAYARRSLGAPHEPAWRRRTAFGHSGAHGRQRSRDALRVGSGFGRRGQCPDASARRARQRRMEAPRVALARRLHWPSQTLWIEGVAQRRSGRPRGDV